MKKFITTCLLGLAVFSAGAVESSVTFTYAGAEFDSWGKGKSEIYDVAIRISDPTLAGKKITAIRAALNACEGIESTSLWLSKELTLEKQGSAKVTVPDTYVAEVAPEAISISGAEGTFGQLYTELDTPYVITEEGIYVGYSFTVPSAAKGESLSEAQKNPLLLSPSSNPESLYVRLSKDVLKWTPYNEKLGEAAMIYVTLQDEFAEYSVGIKNMEPAYAKAGEDFTVRALLSNIGSASVTELGYSYSIAGHDFTDKIELATPMAPDFVNSIPVDFPIAAVSEIGEYPLNLKINAVNGSANDNVAASASATVSVLPFVPVHRPMLEEFTGTWCGWCTRGYWALEKLNELYGDDVVLAAYHDGDPMAVTEEFPVKVPGFPASTLNRNGMGDPYYGSSASGFGMKDEMLSSMQTVVPAGIDVEAVWRDDEKTSVAVKATATFLEDKADAGYRIGYLLIANGLSDMQWSQTNYYSRYAGQMVGDDLEVLSTWPSMVRGLVFNDVVVDVSAMNGVEGSIPGDVAFNVPYANEFEFDIAGNGVIQDKDKLYVAAFIINPDGSILNANKAKVEGSLSVGAMESEGAEVSAEYLTLSGVRVTAPGKGVFVKVSRLADGSVRTSKIVR